MKTELSKIAQDLDQGTITENETKSLLLSLLSLLGVVVRFFKWVAIIIISLNMGAFLGKMTFKLILWTGLLPYLEKFFSWIVW